MYPYWSVLGLFFCLPVRGWAPAACTAPARRRSEGLHTTLPNPNLPSESASTEQSTGGMPQSGYHPATKGYWRLRTDYATRRTLIEIFTWEKKLVYQEHLPGKYLKLNRRNTQWLNQFCDRLLDNQLVANQVKASPIPEEENAALYGNVVSTEKGAVVTPLHTAALQANAILTLAGKLQTFFVNPTGGKVLVQLRNESREVLYEEYSTRLKYGRMFDLAGLPAGIYTLKISSHQGPKYLRQVRVRYSSSRLIPEWVSPSPQPIDLSTDEPLVEWIP